MLSADAALILGILLGLVVLFIAFRWGTIGGGGAGADRDKNPINFWLGVTITGVFTLIAIAILIGNYISPNNLQGN